MTCIGIIIVFLVGTPAVIEGMYPIKVESTSLLNTDQMVYSTTPEWISAQPHYSTGAALADFNRDGWLDLVVSDGNDMQLGHLNVYYNDGNGAFPTTANWQSDDSAYNGHLDVGDVNGDGWPDVAVAHLGEFNTFDPIARIYLNNGGVLSPLPDWTADIVGNAFGIDFGDINNDGHPDLAVATGWAYSPQHYYHNYVYLNTGKTLEYSASWMSEDTSHYQGCLWVDADDDGWLDLACIGAGQETQIYRNLGGTLEKTASWQTSDSAHQDGIMLTAGDITNDHIIDLFATDNTQLGGDGLFKQYIGIPDGFFETRHSWSFYGGYGSAVALADVNGDGMLDLATGAWWDHINIFFNGGSGFIENPSWTSEATSVVEKIVFGDIGPTLSHEQTFIDCFHSDRNFRLFYLSHQPIQGIQKVIVDDATLDPSKYAYSLEHGWVTIGISDAKSIEVVYTYSCSLDMLVSNWDSDIGNYLYYNHLFADLECDGDLSWTHVSPGEPVRGSFKVSNIGDPLSSLNWKVDSYPRWGNWTFTPKEGKDLKPQDISITVRVSVAAPHEENTDYSGEIRVVNTDNPNDFSFINVSLSTPVKRNLTLQQSMFLVQKMLTTFPFFKRLATLFLWNITC